MAKKLSGCAVEKVPLDSRELQKDSFLLTSWLSADVKNWDFGIGRPSILRTWDAPLMNGGIIFADCQAQSEPVYDMYVSLNDDEQDLLVKDEEFRSWFDVL